MSDLIIPTIGATGFYQLAPPFNSFMIEGEMYTCQAVRRIGDYIALNEDIEEIVYQFYGLTDEDFEADRTENMYILSLQSESGQWLYVPARYLLSYPIMDGIPYRSTMLGVSLGAIPADMDLSAIQALISDVVYDNLGIRPEMQPVVLSKSVLVSRENHDSIETARLGRASIKRSYLSLYRESEMKLTKALEKIQSLEQYIKSKYITP